MTQIALITRTSRPSPERMAALDGATQRRRGNHRRASAELAHAWLAFKRLTQLGFPRRFPIVQFPNLPLVIAFFAGESARLVHGSAHHYSTSVSYLAMTIWAYEELAHGVNWFRRLLGVTYVFVMVVRVAHALHG